MGTGDGVTGAYSGHLGTQIAIGVFLAIGWYNAIELCALVFIAFNTYRGLYFWSLLLTALVGVVPYCIGFLLKFFELMESIWLAVVLLSCGWWVMITGQSFVLYSRLHLVLRDEKVLRRVLCMIIVNVFILHVPTTILTFGSNSNSKDLFVPAYNIMEKIQMTGFCIQEFIISTLYIWETVDMLKLSPDNGNRKIMYQLLGINLIFILMDIGLLAVAYANLYVYETTLKAMIYSVKLKLEFAVLGKLVHLVNSHSWSPEFSTGPNGYPDFVDPNRITSDVSHAPRITAPTPKPPWLQSEDVTDATMIVADLPDRRPSTYTAEHSETDASLAGVTQTAPSNPNTTSTSLHFPPPLPREKKPESNYPESKWPD
ncbi:uncharacterized protein PADG_00509 [Paracoccidioides brasiliensis Pb18]|uniref:DUF7703 domain-containing protein n=1 Tax=Paracoccidioides brasiliensis (strain Pb18) TaxID=502780 RepID=C1G0W9_PARBD|nr:uncharacterized protein PADG_00509 [Paracoccidioides brasiliensis Pb18]EEH44220.1 hypothetical protein PADG_00509 [Paracoccidioides brasiliensis Pb18]